MLARAFADDPTSAWLFPRVEGRARALEEWYRINSQILLATGEGWGTEKLESAALWLPVGLPLAPGAPHKLGRLLLWNLLTVWKLGSRVRQAAITTARLHRLHPPGPAWYLAILGTEPRLQGIGLGSAVLRPVLERCDRMGVQSYLDTATYRDVHFYAGHGFEVVSELDPVRGPHFWVMRRQPIVG